MHGLKAATERALSRGGRSFSWVGEAHCNFQRFCRSDESPVNLVRWQWRWVLLDLCSAASLLPDTCSLLASLLSSAGTPNLVVTLSTRFADASLKYLRFSREIDWNNFSHTDSFERSRLQKREQQRRRWFFFRCFDFFPFRSSPRSAAMMPIYDSFGNLQRWQTFVTFDEFSWEFFFALAASKMRNTLFFLITTASSTEPTLLVSNTSFTALKGKTKRRIHC